MARLVFFGTPTFAVPSLRTLLATRHTVTAVVTQPDRPQGRGKVSRPAPVKTAALAAGLPVLGPESCREEAFLREIAALRPDYLVVVAYGQILPNALLDIPSRCPINLHASLLPRWRGASPIAWSIVAGDTVTGDTTMVIRPALDTGEILLQREEGIRPDDTAASLGARLALAGGELLTATIDGLESGTITPVPQDESRATHAPLMIKQMGLIDWAESSEAIGRKVRGFFPWPKAFSTRRGLRITILSGTPVAGEGGPPGTVIESDAKGGTLVVACGEGAYRLFEVQPESKPTLNAADFVRGYRVTVGECWGQ